MTIKSIRYTHDGTTYTATVGEFLTSEKRRRARSKRETERLNSYLGPVKGFVPVTVAKITDEGVLYLVYLDLTHEPHGWANPFMVGKHDTLEVHADARENPSPR